MTNRYPYFCHVARAVDPPEAGNSNYRRPRPLRAWLRPAQGRWPTDPQSLLQYAESAQSALDITGARAAYKKFLTLFPDDPSAAFAKQQLKTLAPAVSPPSGG